MQKLSGDLAQAVQEAIGPNRHLGIQLYVSIRGRAVCDIAAGRRDDGEAVGHEDLMVWFSAGKPLLAAAVCRLWSAGRLDLDEPVATYLPPFGGGGKKAITSRHLLAHTGGRMLAGAARGVADAFSVDYEPAVRVAMAARMHPDDSPGCQSSYSASILSWLVLSQLVRHFDGRRFDAVIAEQICRPLGIECFYGFSGAQLRRLGGRVCSYTRPRSGLYLSDEDAREGAAIREVLAGGAFHRSVDPGAGLWASARSIGRFYELLCARAVGGAWAPAPAGDVLDEPAVAEMIRPQRPSFFEETPLIDFGLGVSLETRRLGPEYAYFGDHCSLATFGHQGHGAPMAFADPAHGLVVSFNGNGLPGRVLGKRIWRRISEAIYRETGLASPDGPALPSRIPARRYAMSLRPAARNESREE